MDKFTFEGVEFVLVEHEGLLLCGRVGLLLLAPVAAMSPLFQAAVAAHRD